MSTVTALLDALRAQLAHGVLPAAVSSVTISASARDPQISVQLAAHDTAPLAAALLAWADTTAVRDIALSVWRVPDGTRVLLSMTATLPDRTRIQVYGGLPHTSRGPGADLAPDTSAPIALDLLRTWAPLGEVEA